MCTSCATCEIFARAASGAWSVAYASCPSLPEIEIRNSFAFTYNEQQKTFIVLPNGC